MAIQMRRGQLKDFDANKMLPGEFAVTIDEAPENQKVFNRLSKTQEKRQRQRMKLSTRLTKS